MSKRIIILGASGFIGKALCSFLNKKKKSFLGFSSKDCDLLSDISLMKLSSLINEEDTIIFISALAPCKDNIMYEKNILMLKNFIKYIEGRKIKHIVYLSSDAVYEDTLNLINEDNKKTLSNMHAKMHSKREELIYDYCDLNRVGLTVLRPTLIYGPGDTHNGYGPNKFIRSINNERDIVLFGRGEERRDHIYILDVVAIITEVIEKKILGTFTLATGEVISFYKIAEIICKEKELLTNRIKFNKRVGEMPHNGYRAFDTKKLKKNFNNIQLIDIEQGIKRSINKLF